MPVIRANELERFSMQLYRKNAACALIFIPALVKIQVEIRFERPKELGILLVEFTSSS